MLWFLDKNVNKRAFSSNTSNKTLQSGASKIKLAHKQAAVQDVFV